MPNTVKNSFCFSGPFSLNKDQTLKKIKTYETPEIKHDIWRLESFIDYSVNIPEHESEVLPQLDYWEKRFQKLPSDILNSLY